jgi:signal transduction histidine kinase
VSDDGNGAEESEVGASPGLGLKAVARQLQAHFARDAEFALDTGPRRGFTVRLTMPARVPNRGSQDAHDIRRRR